MVTSKVLGRKRSCLVEGNSQVFDWTQLRQTRIIAFFFFLLNRQKCQEKGSTLKNVNFLQSFCLVVFIKS